MPRVARFKIAAIQELHRQLEYAPDETRARQMNAAERLIADIDPKQNYPEDFIIYRITGYRSDQVDEPVTLVGQALLPDLVNLVQLLSEQLALPPNYKNRRALFLPDVATRLNVSEKTIQRYRKQGLVCHYISLDDGMQKLACFDDALERFIANNHARVDRASSFTRLDDAVEAQMIEKARELRQREFVSLNEAALRLAREHDRAHETIRMLLRRHDRQSPQPIFTEPGPLTDQQIAVIHRAWQRGVEPARMAQRFSKTKPTIHRAINHKRGEMLRAVNLQFVPLPTFNRPDADRVILSAPAANIGFDRPGEALDVIAVIQAAHAAAPDSLDVEHALVGVFNFLKARSAEAIANLPDDPSSEELDRIETDLRWVACLHRRLILLGFPAALRRIEHNLGRPLSDHTAEQITAMVAQAINVIAEVVDELDPGRGQRLERVAGFAMERALAKASARAPMSRAAARHGPGSIKLAGGFGHLHSWMKWLALRGDLLAHVDQLQSPQRDAIRLRYGLAGERPMTFPETAKRLNAKAVGAVRMVQRAVRELRALARR